MQDLDLSTIKLLVDDEAHCTKLMEAFLKQAGFSRVTVTNEPASGRAAVSGGQAAGLVALDMRMPHMDGFEVMRAETSDSSRGLCRFSS